MKRCREQRGVGEPSVQLERQSLEATAKQHRDRRCREQSIGDEPDDGVPDGGAVEEGSLDPDPLDLVVGDVPNLPKAR